MARRRRLALFGLLGLSVTGPLSGEPVFAQGIDTLGLPGALRAIQMQIPVETQPGPLRENRRILLEPIVGGNSIGLQNTASRALTFRIEIGRQSHDLTLAPQEIMTLNVGEEPGAQVTIGSGDKFTTTQLAKGQIYLLMAKGGEWVFSGL